MRLLRRVQNYEDPLGPKFEADYASGLPEFQGHLKVVSYNINRGNNVEQAVEELTTYEGLRGAGALLLQEMDEHGTDQLASALGYNYVYYPASVMKGKNFGNAILAHWPLHRTHKILLPRRNPTNGQIRIAVGATIQIGETPVALYCVHTEIYAASSKHRKAQVAAMLHEVREHAPRVVLAGDFNTVSRRSIQRATDFFGKLGFVRASKGCGPTVRKFGINSSAADHIFARGMSVLRRGKIGDAAASDHYPLWADFEL